MRRLSVQHTTVYRYAEPVGLGEHRLMCRPRESHDLRLIKTRLAIAPQPKDLHWLHDVFDNSVAVATFSGETAELRFDSEVTIELTETALPDYRLETEARTFPFAYSPDERPELERALERRHPAVEVDRWAARFLPASGSQDTMSLRHAMTVGIHEQFIYSRRTERGIQTPSETLQRGRGTCRDFALLMMEGVRALGLAARFVSGYVFVPGPALAAGQGSTHAWLQVYLPGAGWVDFDPTNRIIGTRNLIRVAVAWDPAHVLPLWGTFTGSRSSYLGMEVTVRVVDETHPSRRTVDEEDFPSYSPT